MIKGLLNKLMFSELSLGHALKLFISMIIKKKIVFFESYLIEYGNSNLNLNGFNHLNFYTTFHFQSSKFVF